jgi:hypothetical protein
MGSDSTPNLTFARQLAHLKRQKEQALSTISPTETCVAAMPKMKNGKPVIDEDTGLPAIVEKRVLKCELIAKEHDERIENFKAGLGVR